MPRGGILRDVERADRMSVRGVEIGTVWAVSQAVESGRGRSKKLGQLLQKRRAGGTYMDHVVVCFKWTRGGARQ